MEPADLHHPDGDDRRLGNRGRRSLGEGVRRRRGDEGVRVHRLGGRLRRGRQLRCGVAAVGGSPDDGCRTVVRRAQLHHGRPHDAVQAYRSRRADILPPRAKTVPLLRPLPGESTLPQVTNRPGTRLHISRRNFSVLYFLIRLKTLKCFFPPNP